MRTNIVIDDDLLAACQKATGIKTKKGVVEHGLKMLLSLSRQREIKRWRGKLPWKGDLEAMRSNDRR